MNIKGYTLVELIVGLGLFAVVFTVSGIVLFSTLRSSRKAGAVAQAKSEGAYALRSMSDMVRYAETTTCLGANPLQSNQLQVDRPNSDRITYSFDTSTAPDRVASASGAVVTGLTSANVAVTVPADCSAVMFTCVNNNRTVTICFAVNKVNGIDVSDNAMGANGIVFKTQVTVANAVN